MNTLATCAIAYAIAAPLTAVTLGLWLNRIHQSQALSPHRHRDLLSADCSILATRLDQQEASARDQNEGGSGFHHGSFDK
ncbi:hypothetical protein [Sphingomonas crocodyli]|uniref:Uncharacterized protein n=1 Tax=Sphingomonas crocodyli TaxID=1979270 RepID=A0A437M7M7_9SPHN|nr:hypothetical protein [Sphingomonas crocodyli]RVT93720.1 hypothetical protein EOD43_07595 [Sphingomonas crocodyli]